MTDDESTGRFRLPSCWPRTEHLRRRRPAGIDVVVGNSDEVSVAELTGEIPVIRTGEIPVVLRNPPLMRGCRSQSPKLSPTCSKSRNPTPNRWHPTLLTNRRVLKIAGSQNEPTPTTTRTEVPPQSVGRDAVQRYLLPTTWAGGGSAGSADEAADGTCPAPGKLAALRRACSRSCVPSRVAFGVGCSSPSGPTVAMEQHRRWCFRSQDPGLVVAVRVVRKTEIVSTLTAVAVGARPPLGPLACFSRSDARAQPSRSACRRPFGLSPRTEAAFEHAANRLRRRRAHGLG